MDEHCAVCEFGAQVSWCPTWDQYLCASCLAIKVERLLRDSSPANAPIEAF